MLEIPESPDMMARLAQTAPWVRKVPQEMMAR
jgi:hypothetical protein